METSADNHDAAARVAALRPIRRPAPRRRGATRAQSRSLARSGKTGGFLGAPGLRFIPAVEVGGTREFLLQADDVVFVFLGSPRAIAHIFQAAWAERLVLKPGLLYLRTSWGLFWTRDFRALRGFKRWLSDPHFLSANGEILVNLRHACCLDRRGRVRLLGVVIGHDARGPVLEHIGFSRRGYAAFRRWLVPRRRRPPPPAPRPFAGP